MKDTADVNGILTSYKMLIEFFHFVNKKKLLLLSSHTNSTKNLM